MVNGKKAEARIFMRRASTATLAMIVASSLMCPQLAFAAVRVDQTELAQGANSVGGGTATLADSNLDMSGVTANELYTDENLAVNFNGGNDIENVSVAGSAEVSLNFTCENDVEEVHASGTSNVTVNANGDNEFEEIEATEQSNLTINVTGENEFEEIVGRDDANITIRGTECQKRDTVELGDDEDDTELSTERGTLTIDHVTVSLEGKDALVGSKKGNVVIDTSKVGKDDDNEHALITAGGTMQVRESVIDIKGTVKSKGAMTIEHSDVEVSEPDSKYGDGPYRVYSETSIELIRQKNGEVEKGEYDDKDVYYVDTDDNDGKEVDLEEDGKAAYYKCKGDSDATRAMYRALPMTGDDTNPLAPIAAALGAAAAAWFAKRRMDATQE